MGSMSFPQRPTSKVITAVSDAKVANQLLFEKQVNRWRGMLDVFRKHEFSGHDLYYLAFNASVDDIVNRYEDENRINNNTPADWLEHVKLRNAVYAMIDTAQYAIRETLLAWKVVPQMPADSMPYTMQEVPDASQTSKI